MENLQDMNKQELIRLVEKLQKENEFLKSKLDSIGEVLARFENDLK